MTKRGAARSDSKARIFVDAARGKGEGASVRTQLKFEIQLPSRSEPARGVTLSGAPAGSASFESASSSTRAPARSRRATSASRLEATMRSEEHTSELQSR